MMHLMVGKCYVSQLYPMHPVLSHCLSCEVSIRGLCVLCSFLCAMTHMGILVLLQVPKKVCLCLWSGLLAYDQGFTHSRLAALACHHRAGIKSGIEYYADSE